MLLKITEKILDFPLQLFHNINLNVPWTGDTFTKNQKLISTKSTHKIVLTILVCKIHSICRKSLIMIIKLSSIYVQNASYYRI